MNFAEVESLIAELRAKIGGFPANVEDYIERLLSDKPEEATEVLAEVAPEQTPEAAPEVAQAIQPAFEAPAAD